MIPVPPAVQRIPWKLIALLSAITGFGLLVLYSAAGGSVTPWALQQGLRFIVFLLVALAIGRMPIRIFEDFSYLGYLGVALLLLAVEALGFVGGGSQRWLNLGFMNLQPSELMKVAIVLALARFYAQLPPGSTRTFNALWPALVMIGIPAALVMLQPDLGTALAICATVNGAFQDPAFEMPCHYHGIKDLYMAHTFTTGGMALKWFRDAFCGEEMLSAQETGKDPYALMDQEAQSVAPGSDGLIMLPHLQGAMAPEANPKAKGAYFGITMQHTKAHFIRALMESIGFIVQRNIEVIEAMGIPVNEIRVLGGGSKSRVWNQIKADITGKVIWETEYSDAACLGVAIVSGCSTGLFPDMNRAVEKMVTLKRKYEPNPENHRLYQKQFALYKQLYNDLCPMFEAAEQPQEP